MSNPFLIVFLFFIALSSFNAIEAHEEKDPSCEVYEMMLDQPWDYTVRELEGKLGRDNLFVKYLKNFQRFHFHTRADGYGYEGACYLPGNFTEIEYQVNGKDDYRINHSVSNDRSASFSIRKLPEARAIDEILEEYRQELEGEQNQVQYQAIPLTESDAFIEAIHQLEIVNMAGELVSKTRVYISEEGSYEFWITMDADDYAPQGSKSLESLIDESVFETFRLGTQSVHYDYVDERLEGPDALKTLYLQHPLQLLLLERNACEKHDLNDL